MIRSWVASNRSLVITATSSVVIVALVAVAAIISTGYSAQKFNLNDASVWIANSAAQFVGRANTEVFELNTVIESTSDTVEVVQSGSTVLLFNPTDAKLDIVDPATSEISESVALPPQEPHVYLAGPNAIVYSQATGELWIVPVGEIDNFEATTTPTLNLGANTLVSVDENGLLFGFSPDTGQVFRVDAASSSVVQETSRTNFGSNAGPFSLTSVGGRWAVLNERDNMLETASGTTNLSAELEGVTSLALQKASAIGDTVLIGHSQGLLSVPFGGEPTTLVKGRSGVATAPTSVGGCSFAAWSDGGAWRRCADSDPKLLELTKMSSTARLAFQLNGDRLLLNDERSGAAWAVQSAGQLIDNWDDLISIVTDKEEVEQNDDANPPETEQVQVPPIAVADAFGARPGRSTALPVLLNDYDPNGDVLVIEKVDDLNPALGRLDIVNQGQELQLALAPSASGTFEFSYSISDGRGGVATAIVAITVRASSENSPPQQVRSSNALVVSGGLVTFQVLGDWVDPDGDPMYLADASVPEPDHVSHKPDGELIYADSGESDSGQRTVTIEVSDGTASGAGTATITVSAAGHVPLVADPFVVLAYAGVEVRISPLDHVRGGNATVRLNAVPSKNGVTIKPNFERGTFRFSSDTVGTHYLEYVVTDDVKPVTGIVRVDVAAPPDSNTTPITVPKTVFVPAHASKLIDVAGTDIDPAGGVLLVTGIMNVPGGSNVRAEVLEQRSVRVTLTGPLSGPVVFNYRISNGLAEAEGVITVIEIPSPTVLQAPIARDDTVTVRVGDAITIDVLQNDEHPDGQSIRINPKLVRGLDENSGLLFASGDTLRYLAPDHAGTFNAQYEILGPQNRPAQAQITIQVREPNLDTNHAPEPSRITARVLAGRDVRIDIPLDGVDPDGDSVQLLGQETSPLKGSVVEVGSNFITYQAGEYSAGTDSFTYTLIDSLGARATGTVRVGISQALDGARNPVAIEDDVRMRPGATVSVRVLDNDSDPDGRPLTVIGALPGDDETTAEIVDDSIVRITPPAEVGIYGVSYEISNGAGGTSSNFITVYVADDAPLAYPVVNDTVLTLSDILDQDTVNVNVLSRVFFADGDANDLGVSLLPGYSNATILPNRQIQVTIGNDSQIIPFAISRLDDSSIRSYAFIWVPGFDDALPQLDRRAPLLSVISEDTLRINLNDYVLAIGGKTVRLTDSSTVSATHANGASLVVDNDTLQFTSADLYFGPASISFEVTDGSSASDPEGRKAILVLPINVKPRANQPPDFNGAVIAFEPSQSKVIDLVQLTNYPYSDDVDELVFGVQGTPPVGFTWDLDGQQLTLTANEDAVKGSTTTMSLSVRDAVNIGEPGRIELSVVPSTRPLARPAPDLATAKRGETTVVEVLANDGPTNPFPGSPLTVLQVIGADGASLPAGVTVSVSSDNSKISATVAKSAEPVDVTLQYQVADATNDPDRYVWGVVHISIQDVPDAPAKPTRQANTFVAGELTLRITPSQANNSPVTNYRVTSSSNGGYSQDCGTNLLCGLAGLTIGVPYTFQVIATNAIGDSAPSPTSDLLSLDFVPAAPAVVNAEPTAPSIAASGGSIDVTWSAVPDPNPGTAVSGYVVEVSGLSPQTVSAGTTSLRVAGLANDTSYSVQVYAKNSADVTSVNDWKRTGTSVHTVGPPIAPTPAPQGTSATNGDITLSWGEAGANGGGAVTYSIARTTHPPAPGDCNDLSPLPGAVGVTSPWTDTTSVDSVSYTYYVYSSNGSYCTVSSSGPILSLEAPGQASATVAILDHGGTGRYDIHVSDLAAGPTVTKYQYLLSSVGAWRDLPADGWLPDSGVTATYGQAIDVHVRACRDASENYCGDPSNVITVTPVNTRVTSASCVITDPASAPIVNAPTNQGSVSVSFEIRYVTPGGLVGPFPETDPVPVDAESMQVTAIVNGYPDPGYGEFTCTF